MSQTEYFWAWSAYLIGASIFFALFWYWTRRWRIFEIGNMLRLIVAVILFLPWYTDAEQNYLSPAWLVSLGDLLTKGENAFWRAGLVICVVLILVTILSSVFFTARWYIRRKNRASADDTRESVHDLGAA